MPFVTYTHYAPLTSPLLGEVQPGERRWVNHETADELRATGCFLVEDDPAPEPAPEQAAPAEKPAKAQKAAATTEGA